MEKFPGFQSLDFLVRVSKQAPCFTAVDEDWSSTLTYSRFLIEEIFCSSWFPAEHTGLWALAHVVCSVAYLPAQIYPLIPMSLRVYGCGHETAQTTHRSSGSPRALWASSRWAVFRLPPLGRCPYKEGAKVWAEESFPIQSLQVWN